MYKLFIAKPKPSLSQVPDDILLRIFSEFAAVDWRTDHSECGRWPANPAMVNNKRLEADSITHLRTKLALSLVSTRFNELTTQLLFEFVHVRSLKQLTTIERCLRELPVVALRMARYVRRLDITPTNEPITRMFVTRSFSNGSQYGSLQRSQPFFRKAMRVWEACPKLTHLTVSTIQEALPDPDGLILTKSLRLHCPNLQVFVWRYGPLIDHLDLLTNFASNLTILDLSKVANLRYYESDPDNTPTLQMPQLHTLRGPFSVICRDFQYIELPVLRTVIAEYTETGLYEESDGEAFFAKHGGQIRNFITRSPKLGIEIRLLPNLQTLVFRVDDDLLSTSEHRQHNPSLKFVGLLDILDVDETRSLREIEDQLKPTAIERSTTVIRQLLQAKQDDFPNLICVQFCGNKLSEWVLQKGKPSIPIVWNLDEAGVKIKDHTGQDALKPADVKNQKRTIKAKGKSPTMKAKQSPKQRVPRFAKQYPREVDVPNENSATTLAQKFDFSLNLGS